MPHAYLHSSASVVAALTHIAPLNVPERLLRPRHAATVRLLRHRGRMPAHEGSAHAHVVDGRGVPEVDPRLAVRLAVVQEDAVSRRQRFWVGRLWQVAL